jgi:hypothetical protein
MFQFSDLSKAGFEPRPAVIRSSDWHTLCECPFLYLLKHRLGISQPLSTAPALGLGTWSHRSLECSLRGLEGQEKTRFLEDALREDTKKANTALTPHFAQSFNEDNAHWMEVGFICQEEANRILPLPPHLSLLSCEALALSTLSDLLGSYDPNSIDIAGRFDALLYDENKNEVYILDAKTTSMSPVARFSTIPWEYQTLLYRLLALVLLDQGVIQSVYNLPPDASFGGIMHYIWQIPGIRIREADRKAEMVEGFGYAREVYRQRCREWYQATGEFAKNSIQFELEPPVLLHITRWAKSEPIADPQFLTRLLRHAQYCVSTNMSYFWRSDDGIRNFGKVSHYAPFYTSHPREWRDLMRNFTIHFRDQPHPAKTTPTPTFLFTTS